MNWQAQMLQACQYYKADLTANTLSQGSHHISRRNSSSTDQQAGEQEEEEEGAVGAIVDKLWKDLQIERVSKNWNRMTCCASLSDLVLLMLGHDAKPCCRNRADSPLLLLLSCRQCADQLIRTSYQTCLA